MDDIFDGFLSGAGVANILSGLANYAVTEQELERLRNIGPRAEQLASGLAGQAAERAQFQPFTITSTPGLGQANITREGIGLTAGPQQEALTQQALTGAETALQGLLAPRANRQAQILAELEAARAPIRERERLAEEQRLATQGRLGTQSMMFGGMTPEEFQRRSLIEEQRARDVLAARTQVGQEQQQQQELLSGLLGTAYAPQSQALNLLQASAPTMQISQAGRLSGSEAFAGAIPSIIEAAGEGETIAANIRQQQLQDLIGLLAPTTSAAISAAGEQASQQSLGDVVGGAVSEGLSDLYERIFG